MRLSFCRCLLQCLIGESYLLSFEFSELKSSYTFHRKRENKTLHTAGVIFWPWDWIRFFCFVLFLNNLVHLKTHLNILQYTITHSYFFLINTFGSLSDLFLFSLYKSQRQSYQCPCVAWPTSVLYRLFITSMLPLKSTSHI